MNNMIKKLCLSITKSLFRIVDVFFAPLTYLSTVWLSFIRKFDIERMSLSKIIFRKIGIFPIQDCYYEPFFIPKYLRFSLRKDRFLPGIDFNIKEQLELINKFSFNKELLSFPLEKKLGLEYYYHNGYFESGDSEYLYNIIRLFKPKRIVEIGSGYSTFMAVNAINKNKEDDPNYDCRITCIEPYAALCLEKLDVQVIRNCVENINNNIFCDLDRKDILFIDSSHIIRPQGDVLLEYLEIIPTLKSGVFVHIHDIFTPKDYPDKWIFDGIKFWNEQYLLEAFLTFNREFKIIASLNCLKHNYFTEVSKVCPILKTEPYHEPGSFWITKI